MDVNTSQVLNVTEVTILILEDLEPSRVGAPDLHVLSFSCRFDVPRLIVQLGSDCQRFLVKPPELSISSILSLDDKISVVNQIEVSVGWEF